MAEAARSMEKRWKRAFFWGAVVVAVVFGVAVAEYFAVEYLVL